MGYFLTERAMSPPGRRRSDGNAAEITMKCALPENMASMASGFRMHATSPGAVRKSGPRLSGKINQKGHV